MVSMPNTPSRSSRAQPIFLLTPAQVSLLDYILVKFLLLKFFIIEDAFLFLLNYWRCF